MAEPAVSPRAANLRAAAVCALLFASTWALYRPVLGYGFLTLDDGLFVEHNPHIREGLTLDGLRWAVVAGARRKCRHADYWMPATVVSRMLDVSFFGMDAGAHHRTNALLHSLNAVLLFLVLLRLTGSFWPSAWVAAFFALHPLRVESVAWVTERKDVLCGFFYLGAIGLYAGYSRKPTPARYAAMTAAFCGALASKPMAVTLPAVLLLLDFWPLKRRAFLEKIPLFALSAACAALAWSAQSLRPGAHPFVVQAAGALKACVLYLRDAVWPVGLVAYHPHPGASAGLWTAGAAAASLAVVSLAAFRLRRERPYLLVGWLWYLIVLAPTLGLPAISRADRFTYLPLIGPALMLAWSLSEAARTAPSRRAAAAAAALSILALPFGTRVALRDWGDSAALMRRAVALNPWAPELRRFLGHALMAEGKPTEAAVQFEAGLALLDETEASSPLLGPAREAVREGRLRSADRLYARQLRRWQETARQRLLLAQALEAGGAGRDAEPEFRGVVSVSAKAAGLGAEYAEVLKRRGRWAQALRYRRRAEVMLGAMSAAEDSRPAGEASPNFEQFSQTALLALGRTAMARGDYQDAAAAFEYAACLAPSAEAENRLGFILLKLGREGEAGSRFRRALHLDPGLAGAHAFLGDLLLKQGKAGEALEHLEKASMSWPESGWVRGRLEKARRASKRPR